MLSVAFVNSWVGILILAAVSGAGGVIWRLLVAQNGKLDRIVAYLFTAETTKDGIPGAPGKIAQQDQIIAAQGRMLEDHGRQLRKLDRGQNEVLRLLHMSNGDTIAEGVESLTSSLPDEHKG